MATKTTDDKRVKKYASLRRTGSILDLPEAAQAEQKTKSFRWLSKRKLNRRSDGYDGRGFEVYKDKDGKSYETEDLILGFMAKDMADELRAYKKELADEQMAHVQAKQQAAEAALNAEVKKAGGTTRTNIKEFKY